ncbi:MAG TPA: hypothetical protein VNO81_13335 [Candidatus Nitrosotenuis sp.]|jgi:serine/threonine protein kinase|nr:hypothetical protein [Candidatus Nitrosotenuis sp.]
MNCRSWLEQASIRLLRPPRRGHATVRLVTWDQGVAVAKDYFHAHPLYQYTVGLWLAWREARVYRVLEGVPGVPRLLARPHPLCLVIEYVPGRELRELSPGELPPSALAQLEQILADLHARGVVHLDLGHDSNGDLGRDTNLIWSDQGRLYVLDFAGAVLSFLPGPPGRFLLDVLARHDRLCLPKLKRRFFPEQVTPEDENCLARLPSWAFRLFRWMRKL